MTLAYVQLALNMVIFVLACTGVYIAFRKPRPPKP